MLNLTRLKTFFYSFDMNWIAKLSAGSEVEDRENNISECTETDTPKPLKPVEPLLKPCPTCQGRDFVHGHAGGFFCITCQPNARPGNSVRAGRE